MIYNKIKHIVFKLLVFVLALQILNLSVHGGEISRNIAAFNKNTIGSFNQIDSFWEYVYENISNSKSFEDAHDEGLHNHAKNHHSISPKFLESPLPLQQLINTRPLTFINTKSKFPGWKNDYAYLYIQDITPPPPKKNNII